MPALRVQIPQVPESNPGLAALVHYLQGTASPGLAWISIYGSVVLDRALFRKFSLRAGFDVYPPTDGKSVSMGDVLPEEAKVLGSFRTTLENWAAERKLTTWGALDEFRRGSLSRRVFLDRCAALGLPAADRAFRVLDAKG